MIEKFAGYSLSGKYSKEQQSPLEERIGPIRACIGTRTQFLFTQGIVLERAVLGENSHDVNYYRGSEDRENYESINFKHGEDLTYVISPVDDWGKYSLGYKNCTGIVVAGQDKETGKNISFLSHQSPRSIFRSGMFEKNFRSDLEGTLTEIKERICPGTVDAVIFGGNYFMTDGGHRRDYIESVKLLTGRVRKILGLKPLVITGPKTVLGGKEDDIFYKNNKRILYIRRGNIGDASTESYYPRDIMIQRRKWK